VKHDQRDVAEFDWTQATEAAPFFQSLSNETRNYSKATYLVLLSILHSIWSAQIAVTFYESHSSRL